MVSLVVIILQQVADRILENQLREVIQAGSPPRRQLLLAVLQVALLTVVQDLLQGELRAERLLLEMQKIPVAQAVIK